MRAQLDEACKLSTNTAGDSSSDFTERGLFLLSRLGNLGEGQWFVHCMLQLAGNPAHRCLKCLNRLAWTCKQIHTWFYCTSEARKLPDTEETSSSESSSNSSRKTPPSSDAEKDHERQTSEPRQREYLVRDEATSSSLRRARPNFKRGKTLKKEKQRRRAIKFQK